MSQQYHIYDRYFHNSHSYQTLPKTLDNRKMKKCFVCFKKRCWLSKHTKEEREKSRNWFKKLFNQQSNRNAAQYITNFKEIEFSLDNYLDDIDLDKLNELNELNELDKLDKLDVGWAKGAG